MPNKKNGGTPPTIKDDRTTYVPVGCGECIECRKQKARAWQVRLSEEIGFDNSAVFITLTFSEESLNALKEECEGDENQVAKLAVKRWRERVRKKLHKSPKHWLITELGHEGTERIHLHGLIWGCQGVSAEVVANDYWGYGINWVGKYVNNKTINYIIKYCTKVDTQHKEYKPIVLCSPGIGKNYLKRRDVLNNQYQADQQTNETYRLPNGNKINLPIYYRNHIYTEDEREKLWLQKLDKKERYVLGNKITIKTKRDYQLFENMQNVAREKNKRLGYGKRPDYNQKSYCKDLENLRQFE